MKILVTGSGGREHALCWKLAQSPECTAVYCAPGNGGTAKVAENVDISAEDIEALVRFASETNIDLVVAGQEVSLVAGLADQLKAAGIAVFGPSEAAAQLEGSKGFMKDLCAEYNIPTAHYGRFDSVTEAKAYIAQMPAKMVVKADGLAAGKGVMMCASHDQAVAAVEDMLSGNAFGAAGAEVVIEEWMEGEEVSVFYLCDGQNVLELASAQDHKRAFDGDTGPNTGGMGAYSPAPIYTKELASQIRETIINPTVKAMQDKGCPYVGVLYAGIMVTADGPELLEYNVRFGDPECQVLMARLASDLLPVLKAGAESRLNEVSLHWRNESALTVVMATKGYPGSYEKGSEIKNLAEATDSFGFDTVTIFHAGTKIEGEKLVANGGRVLNVTALGQTVSDAKQTTYKAVDLIDWPEGFCRTDIGWRATSREEQKSTKNGEAA